MTVSDIFDNIKRKIPEEITEEIIVSDNCRIERIISKGHASPPGFWYDQNENEWVILLRGSALLKFEDGTEIKMQEGSYVNIPSHIKHRVEWTEPNRETIWLAVFY